MAPLDLIAALRVGIIDDEELGRICVRRALARRKDITITVEADGVSTALRALERERPDVLFLDVQLLDGTGFDILAALSDDYFPQVVFVTAFDAHALEAFAAHAVDYVLKPFSDEQIHSALLQARARLLGERLSDHFGRMAALLQDMGAVVARPRKESEQPAVPGGGYAKRLTIRDGERHFFLGLADIDWFEAAGNNVRIHSRQGVFTMRMTLREIEGRLDPAAFQRIHRSTIVRIGAVRDIQPWFGGDFVVTLVDGTEVRLSRTFREDALRLFR